MENYFRSRSEEQPSVCPFSFLPRDVPQIRVKDGSKIRNLLRFALSRMDPKATPEPGPDQPESRGRAEFQTWSVVFTASGKGVSKAITCTEIVKRRVPGLHQLTQVDYSSVLDLWEPLEPGLDSLTVTRKIPCIWILLSSEPLNQCMLGYQAPGRHDHLWANQEAGGGATEHSAGNRKRRGGGTGARPHRDHRPRTK